MRLLPHAAYQMSYEGGGKPMLVLETEDRCRVAELVAAMEPEIPLPKRRKPR